MGEPPSFVSPALRTALIAQAMRPATYRMMELEVGAMDQDSAKTVAHPRTFGEASALAVLTTRSESWFVAMTAPIPTNQSGRTHEKTNTQTGSSRTS